MQTARYLLHFKRRREGKTNYKKRLQLLLSKKTRLVVRTTNSQIIAHLVDYKEKGDRTVAGVASGALEAYGWKHSKKNLPAAYLTGVILAKRAKEHKIKEAILDAGLKTVRSGTKMYALVKGVADSGIEVSADPSVFPSEERIKGAHINSHGKTKLAEDFESTKKKINEGKETKETAKKQKKK